ncbi:MAG: hypothetical protein RLZZ347_600 [Candidatus Parcubacteria bacterium]|jgi:hypothetical protein
MHLVDKKDKHAFVLIGSSEQLYFGPDEDLSGEGKVAHPILWAWLRIAPVVVPEAPYVIGATDASWGYLEPTLCESVEQATRIGATALPEKSAFGPVRESAKAHYLLRQYPDDLAQDVDTLVALQALAEGQPIQAPFCEGTTIFTACCVSMESIARLSARADEKGLLIPVSQVQLVALARAIELRRGLFEKKGARITFDMRANIQQDGPNVTLRFGINSDLCQFALCAMEKFSKQLIRARQLRLKEIGQRVMGVPVLA